MTATAEKAPVEMAAEDMPYRGGHGGTPSAETKAMLALAVGRGLIWSPCFDHTKTKATNCRAHGRLTMAYRVAMGKNPSLKVKFYHTKDGALCVIRLA